MHDILTHPVDSLYIFGRMEVKGNIMKAITLEELLEAGCHFGHQISRQNPKAKDYIFDSRDNIHIIDLEKTKEGLEDAANYLKNVAKNGGRLVVLGTKRQAQEVLLEVAKKFSDPQTDGVYWVTKRWIGGTFTNLGEVSKNYRKLHDLERDLKDETTRERFTKREIGEWEKERQKLEGYYGGVSTMSEVPDAIFIIDTHLEDLAVREGKAMGVKVVGITDTNSDPTIIDYPIPANDDAVGSIKLITEYILDAWKEGKKVRDAGEKAAAEKEAKSVAAEAAAQEEGMNAVKAKTEDVKEKTVEVKEEKESKKAEKETEKKTAVKKASPKKTAKTK